MLLKCGVGEDFWESLGQKGHPASPSWRKSVLTIHWKNWCWSWNLNTLVTWCKELTQLKRPWCWERMKAEGERDDRGWGGWMASVTLWTNDWLSSRSWWLTGGPGMLQSMGLQRVGHNWVTILHWIYCCTECPPHCSQPRPTHPFAGDSCTLRGKFVSVSFQPWCWGRLLRVPWTARGPNQSILKQISPECSL